MLSTTHLPPSHGRKSVPYLLDHHSLHTHTHIQEDNTALKPAATHCHCSMPHGAGGQAGRVGPAAHASTIMVHACSKEEPCRRKQRRSGTPSPPALAGARRRRASWRGVGKCNRRLPGISCAAFMTAMDDTTRISIRWLPRLHRVVAPRARRDLTVCLGETLSTLRGIVSRGGHGDENGGGGLTARSRAAHFHSRCPHHPAAPWMVSARHHATALFLHCMGLRSAPHTAHLLRFSYTPLAPACLLRLRLSTTCPLPLRHFHA